MLKNILNYSFGLILAQIIGFISLPIITRIYSAEDFGLYSLVVQFSILLSILISLRHEQTIILENNEGKIEFIIKKFEKKFKLLLIIVAILFLVEILIKFKFIYSITLLSGLLLVFIGFLSSKYLFFERYNKLGISELINKLVFSIFAIISNQIFIFNNLVISYVIALFSKLFFLKYYDKKIKNYENCDQILFSKKAGKSVALSHIVLALTTIIPMLTIEKIYDQNILGNYSLAITVIFLPSTVIGVSIGNIYFEKLSKDKKNFSSCFRKFLIIGIVISSIIYLPLYLFSDYLFLNIFGVDWSYSSEIAKYMIPIGFIGFISGIFDRTCLIYEYNLHGPLWHTSRLITTLIISLIAIIYNFKFDDFLMISVLNMAILYIIDFIFQMYYGSRKKF